MASRLSFPPRRARSLSAIHRAFIRSVLALALSFDVAWAQSERLTLDDAIDQALVASPRLRAANAGVDAALGTERQARLLPNPEFTFEIENFEGDGPYRSLDGAEITYGVSQKLEINGERSARRGAARAERKATQLTSDAARLDLIRDVTVAYVQAVSADESLKLAKDLETVAKGIFGDVTKRVEAAREPLIQKSKAEVAYTTSGIARQRAANARVVTRQKLARLWGESTFSAQLVPDEFFKTTAPAPLETYEARLKDAPDVTRYTHLRDAREAEMRLAQAQRIPSPKLTAGVRQFRDTDDSALIAGISVPIPVFNRNQGEIARARAEVVRADSEFRQAGLMQAQDLANAWSEWQIAALEAKSLKQEIVPQAEKAFRLAREGYDAGRFPYLEVLDAQRTLFEARAQRVDALTRLHIARAEVQRIAGSSTNDTTE